MESHKPERDEADKTSSLRNDDKPEKVPMPKARARPERVSVFKDYLRVFTYTTKLDFALMVVAGIACIGAGVTLPLVNVVFGGLVGNFNTYFVPNTTVTKAEFLHSVDRMALFIFIIFLARFFLAYINKFAFRMIGIRMSAAIRAHYLRCLFEQTVHVLDTMPSGSAAGTITATANTLQLGISEKLGVFIEFMTSIIAAIIIAFKYSWSLTLVTLSVLVFISLVLSLLLPIILKQQAKQDEAEVQANAVASEAFGSIRMIAACGAEDQVAQRFRQWVNSARHYGLISSPLYAVQFGLIFFSVTAAFALAFWYGAKSYHEGRIPGVSSVIVVLMNVLILLVSMERISSPLISIGKAQIAATTFFAIIDAPTPQPGLVKEPEVTATEDIVFRGCTFAYPGRPSKKVLDNLDLTIEAGKVTAIVGPTGCGKSTIVGLLQRWYSLRDQPLIAEAKAKQQGSKNENGGKLEEQKTHKKKELDGDSILDDQTKSVVQLSGTISTCGHELDDIDIKWWRSQIGLVQQEPFLFNDTIFQNVAYGLVGSESGNETEEKKRQLVAAACREAFADEFIDRLPNEYDTFVGDSGTQLSGGQRQRIAIARSIISRPKILVLDEATSAIDAHGEEIVQKALERASRGRTTIVIAHRLSTIKQADRIIVMKSGRIVEQGTHESLLENEGGIYSGLVHAQRLSLDEDDDDDDTVLNAGDGMPAIPPENMNSSTYGTESRPLKDQHHAEVSPGFGSSIGRLVYEQRNHFPIYVVVIIACVAIAAATPIQAYLFAKVIMVFQESGDIFVRDSNFWSLMWFVLAIGVGVSYFVMGIASTQVEHRIGATYRQEYFESVLNQNIAYFDETDHSIGTLTSQALGDPKKFQAFLGVQGAMAYQGVLNLLGGIIISFIYSWRLSLVSTFVVAPLSLFAGYYRFKYEVDFNKLYDAVFSESSKWASESIGAIRTVCSLTLENTICQRYEELLDGHISSAVKKARYTSLVFALSDSISLACNALIFWVGARWLLSGEVSVLGFFIVFMAMMTGAEGLGQALSVAPDASQAAAASNRILKARMAKVRDVSGDSYEKIGNVDNGIDIEIRDVHFKYATRDIWVLKGISITVQTGQFAAIVGSSGSGKSSIISLLERFYDVSQGQIRFNAKDIQSVPVREHRKLISVVTQESNLFHGSIRDNILLGVEKPENVTEEQLHQTCRDASIHDFIVSLPEGYESNVGNRGVALSGGQKQRLAIARALIRNPHVLLLDEATSNLDSESEKLVQAALLRAAQGRTTIAIAHRLATIQHAHIIFVLAEGRVAEVGTHIELLKRKGMYWHMCQSQALDI